MKISVGPKKNLEITDDKHLEDTVMSTFISFNMYKARINRQLDDIAVKHIEGTETYYKKINLKDKLGNSNNKEYKLLQDFGFDDASIAEIHAFNTAEDLDFLDLAWVYKMVVYKEEFETQIQELRDLLVGGVTLEFIIIPAEYETPIQVSGAKINGTPTELSIAQMLYALLSSIELNYSSIDTQAELITLLDATVKTTAEALFVPYAATSEIIDDSYTAPVQINFWGQETYPTLAHQFFWEGYKAEHFGDYVESPTSMFMNEPETIGAAKYKLWMSKTNSRRATQDEYFHGMSDFMAIDYELDQNWFEKFIAGVIKAFVGLINSLVDLALKIPVLGDILEFTLDQLAHIFGMDFEEILIYFKKIIQVIVVMVIAYYTGQYQAAGEVIAGTAGASTYAMAAVEFYGMAQSVMGALNQAEMEWNMIEQEKEERETTEEDDNQSPENQSADPSAPDTEADFMFESMFTVPDWGIDSTQEQSDNEPITDFINL